MFGSGFLRTVYDLGVSGKHVGNGIALEGVILDVGQFENSSLELEFEHVENVYAFVVILLLVEAVEGFDPALD